ncbi:hypothetical protein ECH7EC4045_A3487 [Escherichia coli O157:H7 str. EC4045]|nr:hypothetical protein ECH7EC4045_A3487 [Escherichia coli O157:H7 str. EC4045]
MGICGPRFQLSQSARHVRRFVLQRGHPVLHASRSGYSDCYYVMHW